jgi:hypothetical protein
LTLSGLMVLSDFQFDEGILLSLDICKRLCTTTRDG